MTSTEIANFFADNSDEFLKFDRIPVGRRLSQRPDLHAFILLDRLLPGSTDMVSAAEHDEIFLGVGPDDIAHATTDDLLDLIRCGVRYGDDSYFCMFA